MIVNKPWHRYIVSSGVPCSRGGVILKIRSGCSIQQTRSYAVRAEDRLYKRVRNTSHALGHAVS